MTKAIKNDFDPSLDLKFEREVNVSAEKIFQAWTDPELLVKWFAPLPWTTVSAEVDLRPGGIFRAVMRSPEGKEFGDPGCILEVVENRRLVWTDSFAPGFRPKTESFFTAIIELETLGEGRTRYTAIAKHANAESQKKHEEMGFQTGWGQCLDQLVELVK